MFYKQTPVKITGYGLAAGCQVFYREIYGFFLPCNINTRDILPVRGDNPRALASVLSAVHADKHWFNYLFTILISVDLAEYEIFHAKVRLV